MTNNSVNFSIKIKDEASAALKIMLNPSRANGAPDPVLFERARNS